MAKLDIFWGMTEDAIRERVVQEAQKWLNVTEGSKRHREIVDGYNSQKKLPRGYKLRYTDAWCAAFVTFIGICLGIMDVLLPECGCGAMIELYRKAGRWEERDDYVPCPGDLIMYDWEDDGEGDCDGSPNHVGLVLYVRDGIIYVIEGNHRDRVMIREIPVGARYIRGFCLPDYAALVRGFADVPADAWYREAVIWADGRGIVRGFDDGTFGGNAMCTRAQAVTMLWRYYGAPMMTGEVPFGDVPEDAYYSDAVRWAYARGITDGIAEDEFGPYQWCTRAQIAAMLWRAEGRRLPETEDIPFTDVETSAWYGEAVCWAYGKGITIGCDPGAFRPFGCTTRAQMVAMLYRLHKG